MDEQEAERVQGKIRQERKPAKLKKFYKQAKVKGSRAPYKVELDGKVMKTPLKAELSIPTKALAREIEQEWNGQEEFVDLNSMFLTKYASATQDGIEPRKQSVVDEIVAYASSDLVCYRADAPQGLVDRQSAMWDPILKWAEDTHKLNFVCVAGIIYAAQPVTSLTAAHNLLMKKNPHKLTAIYNITTLLGSALLAMAVVEGAISDNECWDAAHLDEDWNIELWGSDEDAIERRNVRRVEFDGILKFSRLVE